MKVDEKINLMELLDVLSLMPMNANYEYYVLDDNHVRFSPYAEAQTDIRNGIIYIKKSVYEGLKNPSSRSNFTVAHEMGHYFLHYLLGVTMPRKTGVKKMYTDPEWQANQFAAEFLMPFEGVKGLSPEEISLIYNVSLAAAIVRYNKINKE